jgi:hypothetical protein
MPDPLRARGRAEAREACRTLGLRLLPRGQLSRYSYDYVTLRKIW